LGFDFIPQNSAVSTVRARCSWAEGYKDLVKVDEKSKLILDYEVTDASVHDSQPLGDLLNRNDKGQPLYADSAYTGEEQERIIEKAGMINKVHEKGYKNRPLTKNK